MALHFTSNHSEFVPLAHTRWTLLEKDYSAQNWVTYSISTEFFPQPPILYHVKSFHKVKINCVYSISLSVASVRISKLFKSRSNCRSVFKAKLLLKFCAEKLVLCGMFHGITNVPCIGEMLVRLAAL